jgi:thiosulfate/3-mercaptopyruvate sulfurtransferase
VFREGHIPGAVYSNYVSAGWRTTRDGVPGQLPEVSALESLIGGLGIDNTDHVVVVAGGTGALDMASATRVYWTFKVLGHDAVSVLDGGHRAYAAQYPLARGWTDPTPATFDADYQPGLVADRAEVAAARAAGRPLLDHRPVPQYRGEAKHPAATKPGTIPAAASVPEGRLVTEAGTFVDAARIADLLAEAGAEGAAPINFCNTGHWASLGWFALHELLGRDDAKVYDGSMTEWTQRGGPVSVLADGAN